MRNLTLAKLRGVLLVTLVLTGASLIFMILDAPRTLESSAEECPVYQAIYYQIIRPRGDTLSSTTRSYKSLDLLGKPKTFVSLTDPADMFTPGTAKFFGASVTLPERDIRICFESEVDSQQRTPFRSGTSPPDTATWTLSRVGVSVDESYAVLFTHMYCGNLCASASFYLLENKEGAWVVVGRDEKWAS